MKPIILLIFVCCVTVKGAPDQTNEEVVSGYNFMFETNEQPRKEERKLVPNDDDEIMVRTIGAYSYIDDKGKAVLLEYTADEDGINQSKRILDEAEQRLDDNVVKSLMGGGTFKKDSKKKKKNTNSVC